MNCVHAFILALGISGVLVLAGYWLAAGMTDLGPAGRLAVASLAGLGSLLLLVSVVNLFVPMNGVAAVGCLLLPCGLTLCRVRQRLAADAWKLWSQGETWGVGLAAGVFWVGLLWPLLSDPKLAFYDGSANHDNFFWIAGAEHLLRHPYLVAPVPDAGRPFANCVGAITGWDPLWGRMGAEGMLALLSALTGRPPLDLYLAATVALLGPWLAGVFLVASSVLRERPRAWVWVVTAGLQPLFAFFFRNGNLPNLLGNLSAAMMVAGTLNGLRRRSGTPFSAGAAVPWWILAVLGTHGLLCTYPEMAPFVLLPCGLLVLRAGWSAGGWRLVAWAAGAGVAGLLLNPATTIRAVQGFMVSFQAARLDQGWSNIFASVRPTGYLPALTTLAIPVCKGLGTLSGGALSLGLAGLLGLTVRRARDPFDAAVLLSGAGVLLLYTMATGFSYGWQKAAQFSGIFIAAMLPAGGLATLDGFFAGVGNPRRTRVLAGAAAGVMLVFFVRATLGSWTSIRHWAREKRLTREMLTLRGLTGRNFRPGPVLVVGESFAQPFFYGMWATYLLPGSTLVYSARDRNPGGYCEGLVESESGPAPAAILVSRAWAETFDASSVWLAARDGFVLLADANRVLSAEGFYPDVGVPTTLAARATLRVLPSRHVWLHLTLRLRSPGRGNNLRLVVEHSAAEVGGPVQILAGEGPTWTVTVPLNGGAANTVAFALTGPRSDSEDPTPLQIETLCITDAP